MSTLAQRKMTVDEFLPWAEGREGRWELYNGVPYAMPSERMGHIEVKGAVYVALLRAVRKAGLPCHVLTDGAGVPVWLATYRWKEKPFRVVVNAATGEVQGERPWSALKIIGFVLLMAALVGAIVVIAQAASG